MYLCVDDGEFKLSNNKLATDMDNIIYVIYLIDVPSNVHQENVKSYKFYHISCANLSW